MNLELMSTRLLKKFSYHDKHLVGLAKYCDWFLFRLQLINLTNTDKPKLIFMSNFLLTEETKYDTFMQFYLKILPKIKNDFILIIASEDYTFPSGSGDIRLNSYDNPKIQGYIKELLKNKYLKKIYVENLDTLHEKMVPLPLGILTAYGTDKKYNDLFFGVEKISQERKINVLCCHRLYSQLDEGKNGWSNQFLDRRNFNELCDTKLNFVTNLSANLDEDDYKFLLLNSRFNICIHGGGIDPSPKAWQSILAGAIPIIQHSTLDEAYKKLPVVFVDKFDETTITEENLNKWYDELKDYYFDPIKRKEVLYKLSVQYWLSEIKGHLN